MACRHFMQIGNQAMNKTYIKTIFGGIQMNRLIILLITVQMAVLAHAKPADWQVDPAEYEFSMTITCIVQKNGSLQGAEGDYIAAFIDDECRGVTSAILESDQSKHYYYLTVFSDQYQDDTVVIKYYNKEDDEVQECINEIGFTDGENLGTVSLPFICSPEEVDYHISLSEHTIGEGNTEGQFIGKISINERKDEEEITYELPAGETDNDMFGISSDSLIAMTDFNYDEKATYEITIKATTFDGLTVTESKNIQISAEGATAIKGHDASTSFSFYPNPCHDNLVIGSPDNSFDKAFLYNITGKQLREVSLNNQDRNLDVSGFHSGVYIIKFTGEKGSVAKQLIIE